ncbi:anti-sigma factor [Leptospirillum ferriphilum]|uniref:anti-sigma factor n=1 Tax=Leptospirillum ferriphilum TaxID=178606 RepID=UPI003EE7DF22
MGRSLMSCKDVSRLIGQSLDGRLPLADRIRIRVHLLFCEACKRFSFQVRFLEKTMEATIRDGPPPESGSPGLSPEARERILGEIRKGKNP